MSYLFSVKNLLLIGLLLSLFAGCETDDVDPPPPTVSLTVSPAVIAEDMGEASLTLSLSAASSQSITVTLETSGTATEADFSISSLSVNIPTGSTTATVTLTAVQDDEQEGDETVIVAIASVTGAVEDGNQEVSLSIEDDDVNSGNKLILNEICYDPSNSGLDGDANGDGAYAQAQDEFVELVNLSASPLDVSGYKIYDDENFAISSPNHTIPANTIIPAGGVLVIFGGGTPTGSFGGAIVQTSTSGDLNLNNAGDKLHIYDAAGSEVLVYDIEPLSNNPNESYTRNPDLTGDFVQHSTAQTGVLFSPGTKIDGSPF